MSTRCMIHFNWNEKETSANIYRHCDGYPDSDTGVLSDLQKFFKEVSENVPDNRFSDPSYLAAKYVVWQAKQNARTYELQDGDFLEVRTHYLNFLSLGVSLDDHGDVEFIYTVNCGNHDDRGFPSVTHEEV